LSGVEEVFQEVEASNADFGVVAVENSSEGTVSNTLDRFLSSPLHICGEVELRIHHCLMGRMDSLRKIKRVCAHARRSANAVAGLRRTFPMPSASRSTAMPKARGARAMSPAPRRLPAIRRPRSTG